MVIQNKKLTVILFLLIAVFIIALFIPSESVYADFGPKSTTKIYLENMPESHYICALLGEKVFPYEGFVAPNIPTEREHYHGDLSDEEYEEYVQSLPEISQRRISYVEKLIERLNKESFTYKFDFDSTSKFSIDGKVTTVEYMDGYYPPDKFIAVVYDIDNDILYYSNPIQRYVFRDQYSADYSAGFTKVNDNTYTFEPTLTVIMKESPGMDWAERNELNPVIQTVWYNVVMFIGRIILTVGVELLIALAFKFTKKSYGIIAITNVATQILLNAIILISMFFGGRYWSSFEGLLVGEAAVFIIEPIVYWKTCERLDGTKKHVVLYALIANIVTLALGIGINLLQELL